jgi:twitching motility protein PilT
VETSGFQPGAQPGGFAPGPAPDETPADGGWTYSFVAEQPSSAPVEAQVETAAATPAEPAPAADWQQYAPPVTDVPVEAVPVSVEVPAQPAYPGLEPAYEPPAATYEPPAAAYEPPAAAYEPPAAAYEPVAQPFTAPAADAPAPVIPPVMPALSVPPVTDYELSPDQLPAAATQWQADVVGFEHDVAVGVQDTEVEESAYNRVLAEQSLEDDDLNLNEILELVLERKASDLHLTSGARPTLRLNGELTQLEEYPILTPPVIQRVIYAALTQRQREKFEENLELDFAYSVPGRARFRVNVYRQRDALGAAFRLIPFEIKKLEDLGIPPSVANFANLPRGFVLVTGPTGSGKSTTLAALLDLANRTRREHIMTVEDPIEFLHRHQACIVNQREVGEDTWSFQNALKHVLRQDPDIILVGEMRDLETISVALTAAETGHLVFATLHTQDAAQTIDRVIDVFPSHQQEQVRVQLAGSLQGVVCQTLCRTRDGRGRAVATEVLVATPAIRNLVREGKTHQIYSAMQAGAKHGMHTMDQHLADLVMRGTISYEMGLEKCHHVEDFNRLTGRG